MNQKSKNKIEDFKREIEKLKNNIEFNNKDIEKYQNDINTNNNISLKIQETSKLSHINHEQKSKLEKEFLNQTDNDILIFIKNFSDESNDMSIEINTSHTIQNLLDKILLV